MKANNPANNYSEAKMLIIQSGLQEIKIFTKPGLPNWDQFMPATRLLVEKIELPIQAKALLLGCGHGGASVFLARQLSGGQIWLMDTNYIALQMAKNTLEENQITNAFIHPGISTLPKFAGYFDAVIIDLPKGRKLTRRWLCEAFLSLSVGGKLYLAGAKQQGIQSAIKDAQSLFGNTTILGYKKGSRIAVSKKEAKRQQFTGWAAHDGIAPGTWHNLMIETPCLKLHLASLPGVFSYDRLDEGTKLLLPHVDISPGEYILDLGCGYGILGILAALAGAKRVDLLDVNLLAIAAALKNLDKYGLKNAFAHQSDVLSAVPASTYDKIYTNPPFHTGTAVDYQIAEAFILQSFHALNPGGSLTLVANKFIRYERLMRQVFPELELIQDNSRYQVLRGARA